MTQHYSDYAVEDFADESESLLVELPTPLAVKVLKNHCSVPFSLTCVPSLMKRGISPHKVMFAAIMHQLMNNSLFCDMHSC